MPLLRIIISGWLAIVAMLANGINASLCNKSHVGYLPLLSKLVIELFLKETGK
jgi:hypothetical protein